MTAPIFIEASMISHSSTRLPRISMATSPARTPMPRIQLATWSERCLSSAKLRFTSLPSSSEIHSAVAVVAVGEHIEDVVRPVERRADVGPPELRLAPARDLPRG